MNGYDYIIVGAGSAGCVLANRLGEDRAVSILVLEAGPMDRDLMIHVPAGVHAVWHKPAINWNDHTAPEPELDHREVFMPRGRVVGGSSSINSMVYMRGHPLDYDGWAADFGLPDWEFARCLPYFKAGESFAGGADPWRGGSGPLGTMKADFDNPLYDAFIAAGAAAGQGRTDDPNGFQPEGVGRLDATKRFGRRCSASVAHLRPALGRGNVTLVTGAQVSRVMISGNRATGVAYRHRGQDKQAHAGREVLLAGGALNSPQLLMLSGIGPEDELARHGIDTCLHSPGVGRNLMDHATVILQWESLKSYPIHRVDRPWNKARAGAQWVFTRGGIAASNIWEAGGLIRGNARVDRPNLQYHFGPVGFEYQGDRLRLRQAFAIHMDLSRPRSRGQLTLASADPAARPVLRFNYMADPRDLEDLIDGVERTRELVAQAPFEGLRGAEIAPGPGVRSRADIATWIRANQGTDFHPCGTCAMGHGPQAVVDAQARVHGIEGLRVVDASIMPRIPSANLNAPTQMIAARIAAAIRGDAPLAPETPGYAFQAGSAGARTVSD